MCNNDKETLYDYENLATCNNTHFRNLVTKVKLYRKKLIADLYPKQNIVLHYVLVRWMLSSGFKVTKIHRVLQFYQNPSMKTFIDTFVGKRSEARTKVEKEYFKLFLNSSFGRCARVRAVGVVVTL